MSVNTFIRSNMLVTPTARFLIFSSKGATYGRCSSPQPRGILTSKMGEVNYETHLPFKCGGVWVGVLRVGDQGKPATAVVSGEDAGCGGRDEGRQLGAC